MKKEVASRVLAKFGQKSEIKRACLLNSQEIEYLVIKNQSDMDLIGSRKIEIRSIYEPTRHRQFCEVGLQNSCIMLNRGAIC